jgi:hypothetical protein
VRRTIVHLFRQSHGLLAAGRTAGASRVLEGGQEAPPERDEALGVLVGDRPTKDVHARSVELAVVLGEDEWGRQEEGKEDESDGGRRPMHDAGSGGFFLDKYSSSKGLGCGGGVCDGGMRSL